MTRPPPHERPTARQMAAQAAGQQPMQIAGLPADVCPYCGTAMFANGTRKPAAMIRRYVWCRNSNCRRKFESQQPPAVLVREIEDDDSSSSGRGKLTIHRESA